MREEIETYWGKEANKTCYVRAISEIEGYIRELNERYEKEYHIGFIRHVESRIKSVDSICAKMERKDYELTVEQMLAKIKDLGGVRVICFNTAQVYRIVAYMKEDKKYAILKIKDYVENPKKNGYQSLHVIVNVPIEDGTQSVRVEIQIRTILMDAWASLDSSIRYKKKEELSKTSIKKIEKLSQTSAVMDKVITDLMEEGIKRQQK